MRNIFKITAAFAFMVTLLFTSCEKWIDPEINKDPDNVTDVPTNLLLPGTLGNMAYTLGGINVAAIGAMWCQQMRGADRQFIAMYNYNVKEENVANTWDSFYPDILMNLQVILEKSENTPHFAGVAKVLTAIALGNCTNLFGDIPYTEAFQGNENLTPKYDSQEQIFNTIITLLGEGITDLQRPDLDNEVPLQGDMVYGNDVSAWLKLAHTLRARYNLNLSEVSSPDWSSILSDLGNGLADNADDCEFFFGNSPSEANPLYNFNNDRSGYVLANIVFKDMLAADSIADGTVDPRYAVFADDAVENSDGLVFGTAYGSINSPVIFGSYVEAKFIEAEAHLRKSSPDQAAADAAYNAAVSASLAKFGVSDANWEATYASLSGITLEQIGVAKYKALFMQPEAYTNFRRTGYPVLVPVAGNEIPSRLPYPTDERLYNKENRPDVTIFTKMWWMP